MLNMMKDAPMLAQMSFGDKMIGALDTALLGIGVTFSILLIIFLSVRSISTGVRRAATPAPAAAAPVAAAAAACVQEESVSAISAVVAVEQKSAIQLRNVPPIPGGTPWMMEGRTKTFLNWR